MRKHLAEWLEQSYAQLRQDAFRYVKSSTAYPRQDPEDVLHNALEYIIRHPPTGSVKGYLPYARRCLQVEAAIPSLSFRMLSRDLDITDERLAERRDLLIQWIGELTDREQEAMWKYLQGTATAWNQTAKGDAIRALRLKAQAHASNAASDDRESV